MNIPANLISNLDLLDQLVNQQSEIEGIESDKIPQERNVNEILKVADFLFGPLLDSALEVLEQPYAAEPRGVSTPHNPTSAIRSIQALPSKRQAYFVRRSSLKKQNSSSIVTSENAKSILTSTGKEYLCLIKGDMFLYCSCRSFYNNMKSNCSDKTNKGSRSTICKHILAIKLAGYLEDVKEGYFAPIKQIEVTDIEFGQVIRNNFLTS